MSQETLVVYIKFFNFGGQDIDEALRSLLYRFRLPGEAQQIDRIMEKFASRWYECNPGIFAHEDVAFTLAFSLIMLNTDLHSDKIAAQAKMTLEGFVSNNRGINAGGDLPESLLTTMFERISRNPIRMDEADMFEKQALPFVGAAHSGWLSKKGSGVMGMWQRHWFLVNNHCLYYFANQSDDDPRCIIPLQGCVAEPAARRTDIIIRPKLETQTMKSLKGSLMEAPIKETMLTLFYGLLQRPTAGNGLLTSSKNAKMILWMASNTARMRENPSP